MPPTTTTPTFTPSPETIRTLRTVLADLYADRNSASRLATDAGLNTSMIDFSGNATNIWHNILTEARKSNKLVVLLQSARQEYPNTPALQQVLQGLPLNVSQGQSPAAQPANPAGDTYHITINNPQVPQNIGGTQVNTGGGTYVAGDVNAGQDFIGRDKKGAAQQ